MKRKNVCICLCKYLAFNSSSVMSSVVVPSCYLSVLCRHLFLRVPFVCLCFVHFFFSSSMMLLVVLPTCSLSIWVFSCLL